MIRPAPRRLQGTLGLLMCYLLDMGAAHAAESLTASVDPRKGYMGDSITVEFTVKSGGGDEGKFRAPSWDGFKVVGKSQHSQIQMVNFSISKAFVYQFRLTPTRPGTLTIGPASYVDDDGTLSSRPVNVEIEDPGSPDPPSLDQQGGLELGDAEVALVARLSTDQAVPGQQILLTYTLYTRRSIAEYVVKDPDLSGFWVEDLSDARKPRFRKQRIGAHSYETGIVKRYLLFPLDVGERTIPEAELEVIMVSGRFRRRQSRRIRHSNPVSLWVNPLQPPSPDFSGAVGQLVLRSSLDRQKTRVGEPVALRLELSGTANFKHFSMPPPRVPDGFRGHPPSSKDDLAIRKGRLVGSKVTEIILTPERAGNLVIPPVSLSFFDPHKGRFRTARSRSLRVQVEARPGATGGTVAPGPASGPGAATLVESPTLRPIRARLEGPRLRRPIPSPLRRTPFWLVFAVPPLLGLLLVGWDRVRARQNQRQDLLVVRRANRRGRRRLADAGDHIKDQRPEAFFTEVARTLLGYLEDRTGQRLGGLTVDELALRLRAWGYPDVAIQRVVEELENCDMARFAASASSKDEMQGAISRVRRLLDELDAHRPQSPEASA